MNQFTIDPAIVDPNDVPILFSKMYPDAGMMGLTYVGKEHDGKMTFMSNVEINTDELLKYLVKNADEETTKREDKLLQVECKVIKYDGNYYILDKENGNEIKIAIFK
jgi:hypothetical protein